MLVKSPLNYTGDKFRLLPQILPHLPSNVQNFVDLFAGGGSVFANVEAKKTYVNDNNHPLMDLLFWFYWEKEENILNSIEDVISGYDLSRENEKGYLDLRRDYNLGINDDVNTLYTLICHAFNNMLRFNRKGQFNTPFGKRTFNDNMKNNLSLFLQSIKKKDITFVYNDFSSFTFNRGDVVFVDPPYRNGVASYNSNWNEADDLRLFRLLSDLDKEEILFFMTNTLINNGKTNLLLQQWSSDYRVIPLFNDYKGSNHHRKNQGKTQEILVTNYER